MSDAAAAVLLCEAAGATRALDMAEVREVVTLETLTPVPTAPAAVRGVTQVHGRILPVADLGSLCGGEPADPRPGDRLVWVEAGGLSCLLHAGPSLRVAPAAGAAAGARVDLAALLHASARRAR